MTKIICFYLTLIDNENDRTAFEKLYAEMRGKLFSISFNILKNNCQAEDAVSEAFYKIAKKFAELKHLTDKQLRAYCIVTVKNVSLNMIKNEPTELYADIEEVYDDSFINNEALKYVDIIFLKEAISKLKYEEYELLMLFYFYRYSVHEISKLKNINYSAAQKRINRAKNHLKLLMEESHAENKL